MGVLIFRILSKFKYPCLWRIKLGYNKYSNIKDEVYGIKFDSRRESRRYLELLAHERIGEIQDLELQPVYEFRINGKLMFKYIADFRYKSNIDGLVHIEDVKGVRTPVFNQKKKIIEANYGIKIELI